MRPTRGCVSRECEERAIYDGARRTAAASSAGPFALSVKLLRLTEKSQFLGEHLMSVEDAATTAFSADHKTAVSLLHMRAHGVSLLMHLQSSGLPVILHWGADLGDLDGLSAEALVAAFGPTGLDPFPSMMSSLVPEFSAGWNSRAALAGSHDGHTSAASFTHSQSRLISDGPVMPGLIEVGADTVIIEAKDPVNELSLDLAIQLMTTDSSDVALVSPTTTPLTTGLKVLNSSCRSVIWPPIGSNSTDLRSPQSPCGWVPGRLIMASSTTGQHTLLWPRPVRAFVAARYGRYMLRSVVQFSIGWNARCTAGPTLAVASSCRPERSCSAVARPITHRGWCGLGVTGSMPQPRGCIGILSQKRRATITSSSMLVLPAFADHDRAGNADSRRVCGSCRCRDVPAGCRLVLTRGSGSVRRQCRLARQVDRLVILMDCWPGSAILILRSGLPPSSSRSRLTPLLPATIPTGCSRSNAMGSRGKCWTYRYGLPWLTCGKD